MVVLDPHGEDAITAATLTYSAASCIDVFDPFIYFVQQYING